MIVADTPPYRWPPDGTLSAADESYVAAFGDTDTALGVTFSAAFRA